MNPIERAGNALMRNRAYQAGVAFGVPDETEAEAKHRSEIVKAVMESIDTDELVQALVDDGWEWHNDELSPTDLRSIALAVKNWLTGKDQP